jgi:hypothetical protein
MTLTDWIIDIALLLLVVLQLRGRRLGLVQLLLPVLLVGVAFAEYAQPLPTTSNGAWLVAAGPVVGAALGVAAGALTRVWGVAGRPFARATIAAAALWVLGMGFRLGFQVWAHSSAGVAHLQSFGVAHQVQASAWVNALLFMAIAEVLGRTLVLFVRGQMLVRMMHRHAVVQA